MPRPPPVRHECAESGCKESTRYKHAAWHAGVAEVGAGCQTDNCTEPSPQVHGAERDLEVVHPHVVHWQVRPVQADPQEGCDDGCSDHEPSREPECLSVQQCEGQLGQEHEHGDAPVGRGSDALGARVPIKEHRKDQGRETGKGNEHNDAVQGKQNVRPAAASRLGQHKQRATWRASKHLHEHGAQWDEEGDAGYFGCPTQELEWPEDIELVVDERRSNIYRAAQREENPRKGSEVHGSCHCCTTELH